MTLNNTKWGLSGKKFPKGRETARGGSQTFASAKKHPRRNPELKEKGREIQGGKTPIKKLIAESLIELRKIGPELLIKKKDPKVNKMTLGGGKQIRKKVYGKGRGHGKIGGDSMKGFGQ